MVHVHGIDDIVAEPAEVSVKKAVLPRGGRDYFIKGIHLSLPIARIVGKAGANDRRQKPNPNMWAIGL